MLYLIVSILTFVVIMIIFLMNIENIKTTCLFHYAFEYVDNDELSTCASTSNAKTITLTTKNHFK